ncbi:MAG: hypothetical protein WBE75_02710 [Candidatus Omnitrophota bacterium]|jgi:hypothetical protein
MNKLNLLRDHRLYLICAAALFFLAFWSALFFPQRNNMMRLRRELAAGRESMREMDAITARYGGDPGAALRALTAEVAGFNERLPDDETAALSGISLAARKIGLEVVSVSPAEKEVYLDASAKKTVFYGREVYTVAVSFKANGTFYEFYRFLEYLYDNAPALVNVQDLRFLKDNGRPGMLAAEMNIRIFLLL